MPDGITRDNYWRHLCAVMLEHEAKVVGELPRHIQDRFYELGQEFGVLDNSDEKGETNE